MKPRTKIQKEVHKLSGKIRGLSNRDIKNIKSTFIDYCYITNKHITCYDCGHRWKNKYNSRNKLIVTLIDQVCPKCGKVMKEQYYNKCRTGTKYDYFIKTTYIKDFQVVRVFFVERRLKVLKKAEYFISEVVQHWIRIKDGKLVTRAINHNPFGYYHWSGKINWSWWKKIEIRNNHDKYFLKVNNILPNQSIHPILKRNGYNGLTHYFHPTVIFQLLLSSTKAETLFKAGQYSLFWKCQTDPDKIDKYWNSIKICLRNNYFIDKAADWLDNLELLNNFNYDLHSPKYICPDNFEKFHQYMIEKNQKYMDKVKKEEKLAEIQNYEPIYQIRIKPFKDFIIKSKELYIIPLTSVFDVYEEGKKLHHCVYSNDYHTKEDSLLLSARIKNNRLETIEFDLNEMRVRQSRGLQNENTKYHNKIVNLVNTNAKKIKKLYADYKEPEKI